MLCQVCETIFDGKYEVINPSSRNVRPFKHQNSFKALEDSAKRGCNICRPLRRWLREHFSESTLEWCDVMGHLSSRSDGIHLLSFGLFTEPGATHGNTPDIFFYLVPSTSEVPDQVHLGQNTRLALQGNLVKTWMKHCVKQHPKCKTNATQWYPTRILQINGEAEATTRTIKLINTIDHELTEPYVTLSHCWGGADILKLKISTMDSFLDAIPTSTLPKTFIDAVEVAKYLNVRYLWIDSLCIIQDSEEDWKEQATLMGRVYQEALCNIGATGSTDSHGGLFQDRDPESVHTCYITYGGQMFQLIHNEVWRCGIDEAPLNKRAWVVQERVLCQRMLHFGHDQIFWECNEAVACEMYPNGQTSLIKHENFKEKTTIVRSLRPGFKADIPQHALAHLWAAMVKRYTSSRLTYENDKLVALSGLAKAVQSGLEDEYLAGLWKGGVIRQLLWYTPFTSGEYVYPKDFVAPSWSWASIGGVVQYPSWLGDEADCREIAHLTDYHVELGSSDPTGKVLGGFLRIRGPISKIAVGKDTNIPPQGYILNVSASSIQFDISWGEPPEGLFFLCLTGGKLLKSSKVGGLLLKIDKMKNMMRFKRIGIGSVWDKDWIKNNVEGATDSDTVPDEPGISHICTIDIV